MINHLAPAPPNLEPLEEGEYAYPTAHYGRPGVYPHSSIPGRELVIQHNHEEGGATMTLIVWIRQLRRVRRTTLAFFALEIEVGDEEWYRGTTADIVYDCEAESGDCLINSWAADDAQAWRAADEHTGINVHDGVVTTYQHIAEEPGPPAPMYRVESFIPYLAPRPIHREVDYVPANQLDEFFNRWGEYAAVVIDVRPITPAEALEEQAAFKAAAERGDLTYERPAATPT
jgi:hypothetical protein